MFEPFSQVFLAVSENPHVWEESHPFRKGLSGFPLESEKQPAEDIWMNMERSFDCTLVVGYFHIGVIEHMGLKNEKKLCKIITPSEVKIIEEHLDHC